MDKERIVNAALDMLLDDGLIFSVDDLAKCLKIGKAKIYQLFVSKEELVKECYRSLRASLLAILAKKPPLAGILEVYETALLYTRPSLFNRYSINEAVRAYADSLLQDVKDSCFCLLDTPKLAIEGFRECLEGSLLSFHDKGIPLANLIAILW